MEPVVSIVKHGFPIDEPIMYGGVTLFMHISATCSADHLNEVMALAPDVSIKDNLGRTALHFACRAANIETFKVLAELEDTDVDAVTNAGVTPLMMAIESGDI